MSPFCHILRQINPILGIFVLVRNSRASRASAVTTARQEKYTMYIKDIYGRHVAPSHPGEVLREDILPVLGLSRKDVAAHLKISARRLADLLAERRDIDLDLAQRLGAAFGQGAHFWLALQMQRNLWMARQSEPPAIRRLSAAGVSANGRSRVSPALSTTSAARDR
ncbi:MAG: HigA family addiction module antitoxin [Hyphomicrobiaceae bacterium]|nr:HigA family addiction module antitoxin [Hyphomicrobiaceae bacterium]